MPTAAPPPLPAPPPDPHRAPDEEGRRYREGVYLPLAESTLPQVPDDPARFPARGHGPPFHRYDEFPRVPRLRHLIGPSVIAVGMGLGAGEFLLWPNLVTVNGFGIWWLFWVGVLTQFVVIGEIERWTVATGESVFAGMARLDRWAFWPAFFLMATLVGFFWPGWASQSAEFTAQIVAEATGARIAWQPLALLMLATIWLGLAVSRVVYNALERFEMALVLLFFPLLAVALLAAGIVPGDAWALLRGAASVGNAPPALVTGAQFPTLLIAVAYAGSGGTLLLAQSLWLRDKGFGMACYQGRIAGIRGTNEEVSPTGFVFDPEASPGALARFRAWMRVAEQELWVTFVVLILLSVVITTLLVSSTLGTGNAELAGDLTGTVARQGEALERAGGTWLRIIFLLGGAFVLFSTQVGIVDTVTRITGSVFHERWGRRMGWPIKSVFLAFLTGFVLASAGIVMLSWTGGASVERLQPNFLVLVAGPFTIASMYAFALVVGYMNVRRLPPPLRPPAWKRWGMLWAAVLWGWFTAEQLARTVLARTGAAAEMVEAIRLDDPVRAVLYALWVASLLWFAWATLGPPARNQERAR